MKQPYLIFIGNEKLTENTKTALGIVHWRPEYCLGQFRLNSDAVNLGITDMDIDIAVASGIKTLVIGIAPMGGRIDPSWIPYLINGMQKGLDIASGLHDRLTDYPEIVDAAKKYGRNLFDVRHPTEKFLVGSGEKRKGKRLLTVGTDCSVGKMFTSLAIEKEMKKHNLNVDFRATGQTGIFIAGSGVSIDAVISDFVSGATESLSPNNDEDHWDIIEGQGSIYHPSYAAVTLGLVHGSQPDKLVLCHDATRTHLEDLPDYKILELDLCMQGYLSAASLTNPKAMFAGISVNTSKLSEEDANQYVKEIGSQYDIPCCDPVRHGVVSIVKNLL